MKQIRPDNPLARDVLELECSGRQFVPNRTIVGITAFGDVEIAGGYDQGIDTDPFILDATDETMWTQRERDELAEHMIARWRAFQGSLHLKP